MVDELMGRGPRCCFRLDHIATPIGVALVVQDEDDRLRALDWEDHEARMTRLLRLHYGDDGVELVAGDGSGRIAGALRDYLAGELGALDAVAVETAGTEFQRRVWRELRRIRPGTTLSYRQLARRIGRPDAVRAVGLANGANPVGVVVPCHRVIGSDGSLTGYAGGLARKRWLLAHEGAIATACLPGMSPDLR
jgi:methylated-DNA-[protein]-cysteine S-methyltransferase